MNSHSVKQSCCKKYSALRRCLKVYLPPPNSLCTIWGQQRFILFIFPYNNEATSSKYRGQENSLVPLSFIFLLKPETLFISLYLQAQHQKLVSFRYLADCFPLIFHFFESFQKQQNKKSKAVGKRLLSTS